MANETTVHAFSDTGELSRGAAAGLDIFWDGRMPVDPAEGEVPVWSVIQGKWVRGNGGGGAGGVSTTDLNNGYTEFIGTGDVLSDQIIEQVEDPTSDVHAAILTVADSAGGVNVVAAAGTAQALIVGRNYLTLTSSVGCALALPASPAVGLEVFVSLKQDGTGNRNVTWPAVTWPFGIVPATLDAPGAVDEFSLRHDGSVWRGLQTVSYA